MDRPMAIVGALLAGGVFLILLLRGGSQGQVVVVGPESPAQTGPDIMPLLMAGISGLTQTAITTSSDISRESARAVVESGGQALGALTTMAVARESTVSTAINAVRDATLYGLQAASQTAGMGLAAQVDAAQMVANLAATDMITSASVASAGIQASAAVQMTSLQQITALEDIYATERLATLAETNRHEESMFAASSALAGLVGQVDIASEEIQAHSQDLAAQLATALASIQMQTELARYQSDLAAALGSQGLSNDANLGALSLLANIPFTPGNYSQLLAGVAASSVPISQAIAAWATGIHGNASQAFVAERQIQAAEEGQRLGLIGNIIGSIIQAVAAYFTGGASLAATGAATGASQ